MNEGEQLDGSKEEVYLYVDFEKKIRDDTFKNKIFLRIANLDTENPLIQLNDHLFKAEYQDCVGTNLFFEDTEELQSPSPFHRHSSICLKHTVTQFKTLSLKSVKIPSNLRDIPPPEYDIKINDNYNYETLLKKLADGSLNLEDDLKIVPNDLKETLTRGTTEMIINEVETVDVEMETMPVVENQNEETSRLKSPASDVNDQNMDGDESENSQGKGIESRDILLDKYEKLKKLARIPAHRKIRPDPISPCEPKYQKAYEYNCIKSQIIKPSDYFPVLSKKFNKDTLVGAVDIDRSILQGVIKPSHEFYRALTEEEKAALLSMHNLKNLSMAARYSVLKSQLEYLESLLLTRNDEEAKEDIYGRTLEENIGIYKRLLRVLNGILEENYLYNSEQDTDYDTSDDELIREADDDKGDASDEVSGDSVDHDVTNPNICNMKVEPI